LFQKFCWFKIFFFVNLIITRTKEDKVILGLDINVEEIDSIIILRLLGRIDASSSSLLQNKLGVLFDEGRKVVLLDFSNIDYLSSAGIRVLLTFTQKYKEKKGRLGVFSLTEDVLDIIKVTGFNKILNIYKNEKEALVEKNL
ncbi:MAG: STAS domain-containing protein, partial [Parachlamydiales bacterium]